MNRLAEFLRSIDIANRLNDLVDRAEKAPTSLRAWGSRLWTPVGQVRQAGEADAADIADSDIVSQSYGADSAVDLSRMARRLRDTLPASARLGFLGIFVFVMWWSWPREGGVDSTQSNAVQAAEQSAQPVAVQEPLAVVNLSNIPGLKQPAEAEAESGLQDAPSGEVVPELPVALIVTTPTPNVGGGAVSVVEFAAGAENPEQLEEVIPASELVDESATMQGDTILILVPTPTLEPTATATAAAPPTATESTGPLPTVYIVPGTDIQPTPSPTPSPTSTAAPSPTPPPLLRGRGRLWSTFQPRPPEESDHFWVGRPFAGLAANQHASPNYQFGSNAQNRYRAHHGVDMSNPLGTPIQAAVVGEVVHAGRDDPRLLGPYANFYGNAVVIRLDQTLPVAGGKLDVFVLYGHMSEVRVAEGQRVQSEDIVGLVGMTGIAIGPHLHVEIRLGANTYQHSVNPYLWMKPADGTGAVAVRMLTADGHTWAGNRLSLARFSNGAAVWARQIETYLDTENIGPDPAWGENGAMGSVPPGHYYIIGTVGGEKVRAELDVVADQTTFVEIRTQQ